MNSIPDASCTYADFISLILDLLCMESKGRSEKAHFLESVAALATVIHLVCSESPGT